ncbi:synaptonemal complex protein 3-like [Ostrea edulis]|uniref:synaptonemal complex protein 3-like n=1 Tax=Ostrea edulis TaxID=37623 RepID=UPI002095AAA3|nr:synaptonemal complex protein 3-like [Ostrea edulis]
MPRVGKKDKGGHMREEISAKHKLNLDNDEPGTDNSPNSSPLREETPLVPRQGRKRENEENGDEFSSEMQKMLECFGADISKTLVSKRKRLEQYTQNSLKCSTKKVEDIWKMQQAERQKLQDEYVRQVGTVFQQWESDLEKSKEQEEKLNQMFKQQQKMFQQARVVQSQRLKTIKQLHDQFSKGIDELEKCHQNQQSSVQSELKKEMSLLQKKILMDTQQQEMANVRKSLQTMLF